jgi:chemotaxis response regulator CheB
MPDAGSNTPVAPRLVVGIGASAGGLEALERLFEATPIDSGLAFVVVQHLSPDFRSLTDDILARRTRIPIRVVENGMRVVADTIYLLPPKKEMSVSGGLLLLSDKDPAPTVALPTDHFLRPLAQDAGPRAVAVILSGTGSDGSRGVRDVHAAGGLVIAQNPSQPSSTGCPGARWTRGWSIWRSRPRRCPTRSCGTPARRTRRTPHRSPPRRSVWKRCSVCSATPTASTSVTTSRTPWPADSNGGSG